MRSLDTLCDRSSARFGVFADLPRTWWGPTNRLLIQPSNAELRVFLAGFVSKQKFKNVSPFSVIAMIEIIPFPASSATNIRAFYSSLPGPVVCEYIFDIYMCYVFSALF